MPPTTGYWGELTATIDWCEENYVVSYYVAEFWNTLSNFVIIFSPLVMVILGLRQKHEYRFVCTFGSMTVVGIGSMFFHMTLQYNMQLMDELPMVWTSSCFIYACLMMKSKFNEDNRPLTLFMFALSVSITVIYIFIEVPVFLQISYGLMSALLILAHMRMLFTMECQKSLFVVALTLYLFGFLLWNVDNIYCYQLRSLRKHKFARSPAMLFECHAWWHIFTGMGAYMGILFSLHTRFMYLQRSPRLKFFLGVWPYVTLPSGADKIK